MGRRSRSRRGAAPNLGNLGSTVYLWTHLRELVEVWALTTIFRLWRWWLGLGVWTWLDGAFGWGRLGFTGATLVLTGFLTLWVGWRKKRRRSASYFFPRLREGRELKRILAAQWPKACTRAGLLSQSKNRHGDRAIPRLRDVKALGNGTITATCFPRDLALTFTDFEAAVTTMVDCIGCVQISLRKFRTRTGWGLALSFYWTDPMHRTVHIADIPRAEQIPGKAPLIPYGYREDGTTPATLWANQSVLFGGLTRRGKSNNVYAFICGVLDLGIPVALYISDLRGGGIEMAPFEQYVGRKDRDDPLHVRAYVTTQKDTIEMMERVERGMQARGRELRAQGIWELTQFDQTNRLCIVVLDELLFLGDMLRQGADSPYGRILTGGAGVGYIILANAQIGEKAVIGQTRDMYPQRVCYATKSPFVTDAVLGKDAEAQGAKCSQLGDARGVGWSYDESDSRPQKFRCGLVTTHDKHLIASGRVPEAVQEKAETLTVSARLQTIRGRVKITRKREWAVYMFRNDTGGLLYIGKTNEPARRFIEHMKHQPWWDEVAEWNTKFLPPGSTETDCLALEESLIKKMHPKYNKVHNGRRAITS